MNNGKEHQETSQFPAQTSDQRPIRTERNQLPPPSAQFYSSSAPNFTQNPQYFTGPNQHQLQQQLHLQQQQPLHRPSLQDQHQSFQQHNEQQQSYQQHNEQQQHQQQYYFYQPQQRQHQPHQSHQSYQWQPQHHPHENMHDSPNPNQSYHHSYLSEVQQDHWQSREYQPRHSNSTSSDGLIQLHEQLHIEQELHQQQRQQQYWDLFNQDTQMQQGQKGGNANDNLRHTQSVNQTINTQGLALVPQQAQPMLPSLHSLSLPPGLPRSSFQPPTSHTSLTSYTIPSSSLNSHRHRAQTFSSIPSSSLSSSRPITTTLVTTFETSNANDPDRHHPHHALSNDSITKRKRGRMSQHEGFENIDSSIDSGGTPPPFFQHHSVQESIDTSHLTLNTELRQTHSIIRGDQEGSKHPIPQTFHTQGHHSAQLSNHGYSIGGRQNKRPLVHSPSPTYSSFNSKDHSQQQQQQLHPKYSHFHGGRLDQESTQVEEQNQPAQLLSENVQIPILLSGVNSSSAPSAHPSTHSMVMPHFRVPQYTGSNSYMRLYYAPASQSPPTNSSDYPVSSTPLPATSTILPSKLPINKNRQVGRSTSLDETSRAVVGSSQDTTGVISIQLGRLLISTKQHVRGLIETLILEDDTDIKRDHPHLERVLVELFNGILKSHGAFATRDNISSQEQPIMFRPTALLSLSHLRELMLLSTAHRASGISELFTSNSTESRSPSSPSRLDGQATKATRQRSSPLPPSRLSMSTLYMERNDVGPVMDMNLETKKNQEESTASTTSSSKQSAPSALHNEDEAEMYSSTVEFLALMTAFVSIVCWLMRMLLDPNTSGQALPKILGEDNNTPLERFLSLFDDQDNVLKPISDALSGKDYHYQQSSDTRPDIDPMKQVGLFAWHFYLFASDPNGPLVKDGHSIAVQRLQTAHFDVVLNDLYTTHVLSVTAKEHQKDHGQFYTPPGVVEFMWKRTLNGWGNMLDRFVETIHPEHYRSAGDVAPVGTKEISSDILYNLLQQNEPLIPTALDPCLGVSTFLSNYIRLLIQEAMSGHDGKIWNSEAASRLLLHQICEHVWGIELDGFAFWMARCGVIAALMPLVRRTQELHAYAQGDELHLNNNMLQPHNLKLPRLHLFRNDTLQLSIPRVVDSYTEWESKCILLLRDPTQLQFDFIVTNPPYMIRKTGTFSAPDPDVYDWSILGSNFGSNIGTISGANSLRGSKTKQSKKLKDVNLAGFFPDEGLLQMTETDSDRANEFEPEVVTPDANANMSKSSLQLRSAPKGMMQVYGYFILFAAQRLKPYTGISCMITASQWLTLGFASKLRAWLFENCLMDEFFQFEPFKVFSKVQTDSLIFKVRALETSTSNPAVREKALQDHRTIFLRHTDHHKPLAGILQDYIESSISIASTGLTNDLSIMVSSKTRKELSLAITAPLSNSSTPSTDGSSTSTSNQTSAWTYSFAPMMPSSGLTTYLLSLTQDLGGICSAGTKKLNRLSAVEPLLWHRGPNTNPVYGLVTRMEYARANFGETMAIKWFRPALYWNGKNSPEDLTSGEGDGDGISGSGSGSGNTSRTMHKEGLFWRSRDRMRLSKKEGSPAESYVVPKSDPHRQYALCMIDKDSVKVLRAQVEQEVEGSLKLWNYLKDVRDHFQPGLASKKRKVAPNGGRQGADDDGVAFCSTNQCGSDIAEKIIHPINYGYFSKTQPRQRFFLDTDNHAVTNQCIYLTQNKLSNHYNAQQSPPPLVYFLMLLNSSTLQFFILHYCQYDQQGRMRLFRESMAKIPFQDQDVKSNIERAKYGSQLGRHMIDLKKLVYRAISCWGLSGGNRERGSVNKTVSSKNIVSATLGKGVSKLDEPSHRASTSASGSNHGLLDWIRRGGDAPAGVLARTKEQIRYMLVTETAVTIPITTQKIKSADPSFMPPSNRSQRLNVSLVETDTDTNTSGETDSDTDDNTESSIHERQGQPISNRFFNEDRNVLLDGTATARTTETWNEAPQDPFMTPWKAEEYVVDSPKAKNHSLISDQVIASSNGQNSAYRESIPLQAHHGSFPLSYTPDTMEPPSHFETDVDVSSECDKILQVIERAIAMLEIIQWAVDQYGYMLYGIQPKFQKLLELELKLVYSSTIEAMVIPTSATSSPSGLSSSSRIPGSDPDILHAFPQQIPRSEKQQQLEEEAPTQPSYTTVASRLGITVSGLYRWSFNEEGEHGTNDERDDISASQSTPNHSKIPTYAKSILDNAKMAAQHIEDLLQRYPCLPVEKMSM